MLTNIKNGPLFGGFKRLKNFPLDQDSVKNTLEELDQYVATGVAYVGEVVAVIETGTIYLITSINKDSEVKYKALASLDDVSNIEVEISHITEALENHQTTITKNSEDILTNKTQISELESKESELRQNLETEINRAQGAEEYLRGVVTENKESTDKKISDIQGELTTSIENLQNMDTSLTSRISVNESKLDTIEETLENIKKQLNTDNKDFDTFEEISVWIKENKEKIKELDETLKHLDFYSKEEINKLLEAYAEKAELVSVYRYKGSVPTKDDLPPKETAEIGDVYDIQSDGMNVAWNGYNWDELGSRVSVDLEGYAKKEDLTALNGQILTLGVSIENTNKEVETVKSSLEGKIDTSSILNAIDETKKRESYVASEKAIVDYVKALAVITPSDSEADKKYTASTTIGGLSAGTDLTGKSASEILNIILNPTVEEYSGDPLSYGYLDISDLLEDIGVDDLRGYNYNTSDFTPITTSGMHGEFIADTQGVLKNLAIRCPKTINIKIIQKDGNVDCTDSFYVFQDIDSDYNIYVLDKAIISNISYIVEITINN